jgi:hypothetical protein
MLGYRKHSFAHAHALLQTLRTNLQDLATLKELQKLLLREVIRAEKKIRELKTELRTIKGTADSAAARRSSYLKNRIEGFRQCTYIWRCFGDAIAFLYMDKFALKHSFYSTENMNAKQDAGFIAGKEGLANELVLLDSALEHNVPALLVDLTNTIRHGDICLMGKSNPYLIEVKASKKLDSRGNKQKRSLEKLRTFYETDKGEGLRGFPEVRRQAYEMPERTHVDQINECIVEALKNGCAIRQPERGLHYIVMTQDRPSLELVMGSLGLKGCSSSTRPRAEHGHLTCPSSSPLRARTTYGSSSEITCSCSFWSSWTRYVRSLSTKAIKRNLFGTMSLIRCALKYRATACWAFQTTY